MSNDQAQRQYFRALIPAMAVFLALSLFIGFAAEPLQLPYAGVVVLSLLAGAALATTIWVDWRYINAIDEFLRSIRIKAIMFGVAVVLTISAVWGFLELATDAVALPVYYVTVIYWVSYGLSVSILTVRAGGEI